MKSKHVNVNKSEYIANDKQKDIPKWKLFIAKIFKIPVVEKYLFSFRVSYTGQTRLKPNDVVYDDRGIIYLVIQEIHRVAVIVTKDAQQVKPNPKGRLIILANLSKTDKKHSKQK